MMLNVDSSPKWGWPSHSNCEAEEAMGCPCCTDCKQLVCTRCMVYDEITQRDENIRGWLADLCDTLPAVYEIDWVRVYQQQGKEAVGCSPPSHPTSQWIHGHEQLYMSAGMPPSMPPSPPPPLPHTPVRRHLHPTIDP